MRAQRLDGFLTGERRRLLDGASPERLAELHEAERAREVYRAWNAVCAGTREGDHVTGLRFLPATNELLVYLDGASWTQEMSMLREIIRTRMAREGVELAGFKFRTSREGYTPARKRKVTAPAAPPKKTRAALAPLDEGEERALDDAVAPIEDARLAKALRNAMKASLEWKKSEMPENGA